MIRILWSKIFFQKRNIKILDFQSFARGAQLNRAARCTTPSRKLPVHFALSRWIAAYSFRNSLERIFAAFPFWSTEWISFRFFFIKLDEILCRMSVRRPSSENRLLNVGWSIYRCIRERFWFHFPTLPRILRQYERCIRAMICKYWNNFYFLSLLNWMMKYESCLVQSLVGNFCCCLVIPV